jgi:hypothetical protein
MWRFYALREKAEGNPGIWTTHDKREQYLQCLQFVVNRKCVNRMEDFVVVGCRNEAEAKARRGVLWEELWIEAKRARRNVRSGCIGLPNAVNWDCKHDDLGRRREGWFDDLMDAFLEAYGNSHYILDHVEGYCPPELMHV